MTVPRRYGIIRQGGREVPLYVRSRFRYPAVYYWATIALGKKCLLKLLGCAFAAYWQLQ